MGRSNRGTRLSLSLQCTGIQGHSRTQNVVAVRRCGRQELCDEANQRPVKRNGVCYATDDTEKQRTFVRVLAKRF